LTGMHRVLRCDSTFIEWMFIRTKRHMQTHVSEERSVHTTRHTGKPMSVRKGVFTTHLNDVSLPMLMIDCGRADAAAHTCAPLSVHTCLTTLTALPDHTAAPYLTRVQETSNSQHEATCQHCRWRVDTADGGRVQN
jgi:hypothetical protein